MGFAVFFGDVFHIRGRLHHKSVDAAVGDVVDEFAVVAVGGIHDLFTAFDHRCKQFFIIREQVFAVPVGV
ncbi:hypothetical protein SDC9_163302 [bioreactor metagenome]|uniref:Uncharacterized protein n=1 Tax=bioreactor metagenome TaxID=1076179 RepID=A0A645FQI2_9ZZZZ